MLTAALVAAAAPRAPLLVAQPKPARRMVFGSAEYKAAVPRTALLRHVLLTHVSYVLSVGLVQTAVYSCLPYLKDSGVLTQRQISRMLTVGTACFVVGKLSTAQILDQVGPKAAFITNMLIGSLLCFCIAFGAPGIAAEVCWGVYKLWSATSWPSVVQMLAYWSGRRDSVKAFALYSTASRTGAIVASLGVGMLMRRSERGWQIALCGTGVATLLVFLLCKGVVDETPARVLGPNVTAASALEPPRAHLLVRAGEALRRRTSGLEAGWRQQFLDRQKHSTPLWRSESAGPDDPVHLKPAALLQMFAGRANFWLAIGAAMGYSPIRQFEALIPLFLRESRGRSPGAALGASAAATAYHVAYWISAGVGNQIYFKLKQWQQLCMVMVLLCAHLLNLLFMAWCERQPVTPLGRLGQIGCMAVLGGTIAVPATGVLNIFTMDMGKADGSAMLSALLDAAGAFAAIGFFRAYDGLRQRYGWSGVLLLLAGLSAWTIVCEGALLTRDLFKFRRGYVVNPVRTRGSLPLRYQTDSWAFKEMDR